GEGSSESATWREMEGYVCAVRGPADYFLGDVPVEGPGGGCAAGGSAVVELREAGPGALAQLDEVRAVVRHPASSAVRGDLDALRRPARPGTFEQRVVPGRAGDAPPRHPGSPGAQDAAHQARADADDLADLAVGGDLPGRDRLDHAQH